ncbi:predicted protein [Histoplasma capsulatum var. duboisii H88]|uniref:Predicted protein n=2 Tax=Ajellomyces capsulatus TaxID=5037 RepID=F0U4X4_AJEC8|nr:predicted protein [Histoplasma capsulatum H143]EGC42017.1 predicted protein [Histoplasma capsulatum var. duboisii H88]
MLPDNGNAGVAILQDVSRIIRWMLEHLSSDKESFPTTQIGHLVGGFGYIENLSQQLFESKTWLTDLGDITIDEMLKKDEKKIRQGFFFKNASRGKGVFKGESIVNVFLYFI